MSDLLPRRQGLGGGTDIVENSDEDDGSHNVFQILQVPITSRSEIYREVMTAPERREIDLKADESRAGSSEEMHVQCLMYISHRRLRRRLAVCTRRQNERRD